MIQLRRATLAVALSLTVVTGCDNVQWGGADVAVISPPPKGAAPTGNAVTVEGERIPQGPVLYYVRLVGNGGTIVPVGEVVGDSLALLRPTKSWESYGTRFIAEFMRRGSEFTLFHNGQRVGTFLVQAASVPDSAACPRLPIGTGTVELSTSIDSVQEFLALSKTQAPEIKNRIGAEIPVNRGMQVVGPILAERLLRARHAQLPGNWQRAMVQLKPFPLSTSADPAFASTFLIDDALQQGDDNTGYSLFFIAAPHGQVGYDTAFAEYRPYEKTGKEAPRVVDYLDWNRDGQVELLLQVYGTDQTWFEAVSRTTKGWQRVFRDRCQLPSAARTAEAPPAATSAAAGTGPAPAPAANPPAATQPAARPAPQTAAPTAPARPRPRLLGRPAAPRPDTSGARR